jgi:ribosome-associated protein
MASYEVIPGILIDDADLSERFVRSSGPGGQNVNKVSTAVELRFAIAPSRLPEWLKTKLFALNDRRRTDAGDILIEAQRFRTLERNRADARERLLALLRAQTVERKKRIATAPTRASQRRRVDAKKARAGVKKLRGKTGFDE